jgi:hypothetical protein
MNVLAKFICHSVTEIEGEQKEVILSAVYGEGNENKSFSRWTPVADLRMIISNETEAAKLFEPGKEYFATFEAVPEVPAAPKVPENTAPKEFKIMAIVKDRRKEKIIEATNEDEAHKKFKKSYPGSFIQSCNPV